jgi:AcrR family transcriptional regulator
MSTRVCEDGHIAPKRAIRRPVQARSRATVESILGGAAEVLASRGYSATTTNHIAEAAGVSIGSFYQYFADKDDVIRSVATMFARDALAFSGNHINDGEDEATQVRAWLAAVVARASEDEALIRVLFREVPYTWTIPGVLEAVADSLATIELLGPLNRTEDARKRDRAFVIFKSMMAVIVDVAADPVLRSRRDNIVEELTRMIECYLMSIRRQVSE